MTTMAFAIVTLLIAPPAGTAHQTTQHDLALQHLLAGQRALQVERWDEAEREFKTTIELDPAIDMAYYGIGQVCMATKRYAEAIRQYSKSREVYHANAAGQLAGSIDADRRVNDQIRALQDVKRELEAGRLRAVTGNAALQHIDTEIAQLQAARQRHTGERPVTPPYLSTALGSAYFRTNAFEDAEREWRDAVSVDPRVGEVHNNLAVLCMLTGRYDEAEREVTLAEKNGVKVSPQLKADIKAKKGTGKTRA
jgi:tetratricopeptide (TPR) repeat protein